MDIISHIHYINTQSVLGSKTLNLFCGALSRGFDLLSIIYHNFHKQLACNLGEILCIIVHLSNHLIGSL